MHRNPQVIQRIIHGQNYLLPYGQEIANQLRGVSINETVAYIWDLLAKDCSEEEVIDSCIAYYDIPPEEILEVRTDIHILLRDLICKNLILSDSLIAPSHTSLSISIAGLLLRLDGPKDAFCSSLYDFAKESPLQNPDLLLRVEMKHPGDPIGSTLILRNQQLDIYENDMSFRLQFPVNKQFREMEISKDASVCSLFCEPPVNSILQEELFYGIRYAFLYLALKHDLIMLHSASILYKDRAWLFSGHSGMGKSTHVMLWKELCNTPVLNGDLNLLGFQNDQPTVFGTPWCGTSGIYTTKCFPLGGIILLQRALEDSIVELSKDQRILQVNQRLISPNWTQEQFDRTLSLTEKIASEVLVCKLNCTKSPKACEVIKQKIDQTLL